MNSNTNFDVVYCDDAMSFLKGLDFKVKRKILFNIAKASIVIDTDVFKKLTGTDLWEFKAKYNGSEYRLIAFWDTRNKKNVLVIATHGFIKKTQKTPKKEIERAKALKEAYFNQN